VLLDGMPGIDQWITDFKAIAAGMKETEEKLADLNQANLLQAEIDEDAAVAGTLAAPAAPVPAQTPSSGSAAGQNPFAFKAYPSYKPAPQQVVPAPTATVAPLPPPSATVAPAPAGTAGVEGEVPTGGPVAPAPAPGKFVSGIPKAIQGAAGVVKGVVGSLLPKPKKPTSTTAPSTPTTDPEPTNDPAPDSPSDTGTDTTGSDPGPSTP
jgi:hypothetical protein